jgi:hypothetical protein
MRRRSASTEPERAHVEFGRRPSGSSARSSVPRAARRAAASYMSFASKMVIPLNRWRRVRSPCALWLALFGAHLWLIAPVLQNGDAAVYADQIEQHLTSIRTTHVGYIVLGIAANAVMPFGVERNVNLVNLAFAAAGGVALAAIARSLGAGRRVAFFAPLLAFGLRPYLRGSVLGEVDVVACSLVLVALALWMRGRRVGAGLAFAASMLVTPISVLSLPMLVVTRACRQARPRSWTHHAMDVLVLAAASLALYAPVVCFFWHDYWYGGRGLLHAPRERWDVHTQILRSVTFFMGTAAPWLGLGLGGAVASALSGASLPFGFAAAVVCAAIAGERFLDVPVQLPQLCVLGVFVVTLASRFPGRKFAWPMLASVWALTAWPSYEAVAQEVRDDIEHREIYESMAAQTPKLMVVGLPSSWEDGLRFERIVYGRTKLDLGMDYGSFRYHVSAIMADRRSYAIWEMSPPSRTSLMDPLAGNWRREERIVRGRRYGVWIPSGT